MNFNILTKAILAFGAPGTYQPFSMEAWAYAGQMTLIGMGMIFAVLSILWGVLSVFKLIFAGRSPKQPKEPKVKERKQKAAPDGATDDTITAVIAASIRAIQEDEARNDAALVAVLTAAVAAYRASEDPNGGDQGFRVVSFKRVGGGRGWNTKR